MDKKIIDEIVWWIPFKKLRNNIREYLFSIGEKNINYLLETWDTIIVKNFREQMIIDDKNFWDRYINLISGLDDDSIELIYKIIFERIKKFENIDDKIYLSGNEAKKCIDIIMYMENRIKKINDECYIYKNYLLPIRCFETSVFYNKHGIETIKNIKNVKEKNIIDAGAFIGDSAIVLSEYTNKNVYSFEPINTNYKLMLKTIKLNNKKNIIPVNIALGENNDKITIEHNGEMSSLLHLRGYANFKETVELITLDSYVEENNIEVGLIKTDLEGFEQSFLKGAINTIKKQKPVLLISIYHNYFDFFDIKPMIENLNLGYKFKIVKPDEGKAIVETMLIAEIY
ncbi:FkbM family methyltransferase [Brachyspira hyodysenteriae]|uniref:FkbM family methyltransferase n=1 Tax=Brachyspira hyodysenteriae TaxID=159 RepID=UPI0022CDA0D5|nr:FkbM family methyltransferase [Brachyspira hyodysenteriae]MCZ9875285.1 FkbM family methyltransferase [Brachyspira hyodysenteriae]MCZ9932246.1 FkbM family methyltransferase [Brachyspira hyodysenteriae]MCZ9945171.1 FkbM family methyltransferase [Brachyspira hyodysenteriae]MCZ9948003.1 FkbM family methyltransferase [Brachyspira hyodysenteriae]MCZ9965645.1 FkbM family methyltransferase [Brachyspira hyodysenteriae]